jgi:predicted aminopeptidase
MTPISSGLQVHTLHTMPSWSLEAIIAFVTLLVTCVPLAVYIRRKIHQHRSHVLTIQGMNVPVSHLAAVLIA